MPEPKEEIKTVLNEFAVATVEHSRTEAIALVERLLASVGTVGKKRLLHQMPAGEALDFGRTLVAGWQVANANNAAQIAAQQAALAKILTALINAGVESLVAEMN